MDNNKKYIAYYRVSTQKQNLGIDSQKEIIKNCVGEENILLSFSEKESGKNNERIELKNAIMACKDNKAILIVAKLDRLSRDAGFLFSLKNELEQNKIDLVCCDLPVLNTLTLGIFATISQYERELISKRTKEALQELKRQGKKLGNPRNFSKEERKKASKIKLENAKKFSKEVWGQVKQLLKEKKSYRNIATILNEKGYRTLRGKKYSVSTIQSLIKIWSK